MQEPTASPHPQPDPSTRRLSLLLAWTLLLALWVVTLWGRSDLAPPAPLLALVILLPWLYTLAALLLAVLALIERRGRWRWLPLLLLLGTALVLWGPHSLPRVEDGAELEQLRLMTWNLGRFGKWSASGAGRCRGPAAFAAVQRSLAAEKPDLLAIQEVSHNRLKQLAARLGYQCRHTDYYGKGFPDAGGLAACVRRASPWRVKLSRTLPLPPSWHYVFLELCRERRCFNFLAIHAKPYGVTLDQLWKVGREATRGRFEPLRALSAQVEANVDTQAKQIHRVLEILPTFTDPTVIAGDFNATRDTAIHTALREQLQDAWERAGRGPGTTRWIGGWLPLRIDYLYLTPHWQVARSRVLECSCNDGLACSDHRAVLSRVLLSPSN